MKMKLRPMKIVLAASIFGIATASATAQEVGSNLPELRLKSGKVFSNVTVVRLDREKIVLRNASGPFPISYVTIAEPLRSVLLAARDKTAKAELVNAPPAQTAQQLVEVSGVAFSGGMDLPYRFANMRIVVTTKAAAREHDAGTFTLGSFENIVAEAKTDIDGKFALKLPPGEYVIHARQMRSYHNGNRTPFGWRVEVSASKETRVDLTDDNMTIPDTVITRLR